MATANLTKKTRTNGTNGRNGHKNARIGFEPTRDRFRRSAGLRTDGIVSRKVEKILELKAAVKSVYAEIDVLESEVIALRGIENPLTLADGRIARVVDNFIDKNGQPRNVAYKPAGVKRFELVVK